MENVGQIRGLVNKNAFGGIKDYQDSECELTRDPKLELRLKSEDTLFEIPSKLHNLF